MLILSRKKGQQVQIKVPTGNGPCAIITLTLVDLKGGQAKVGIDAPRTVQVMRTELLTRYRRSDL